MKIVNCSLLIVYVFLFTGCDGSSNSNPSDNVVTYQFDLNDSDYDWRVGFADYPEGEELFYELVSEWRQLPVPLDTLNGIYISGNNHSDDLFMYVKRKLDGLMPNTRYSLIFYVQIATNADSGCVGVGGAPGESVNVKAGATSFEPVANQYSQVNIRMNIDHGNQGSGGSDAIVIGNIASTQTDCVDELYELKNLDSSSLPFAAYTDQEGSLWALFATDSGFEATTSIYFTYLEIRAEK